MERDRKKLQLLDFVRKEIAAVRTSLDSFHKGTVPLLDHQMPYVAQLLASSDTPMKITAHGTTNCGEITRESVINLNLANVDVSKHNEETLGWAQLVHYLLHSKGRLTKAKTELKTYRPDDNLRLSEPFQLKAEKAEYLATCKKLREFPGLRSLTCSYDPDWALRVLQIVAPHIEDLYIHHPGPAHFHILRTMPRLRRLHIRSQDGSIEYNDFGPFRWPDKNDGLENKFTYDLKDPTKAWQFEDVPLSNAGVVWLKIQLPRHIALPLIAQHRRTLREISLEADLPSERPASEIYRPSWVWGSNDLPERLGELVERYQFDELRLVELYRISKHGRSYHLCQEQLQAVRKALAKHLGTRVVVICNSCG